MRVRTLTLALVALLLSGSAAHARTPRGFFGVDVDGPALRADGSLGAEAAAIRATGTHRIRVAAYWSELEPGDGQVRLARFDALVLGAARHGLSVLPVVLRTPAWAAAHPGDAASPPRDPSTYARFLTGLVARYGPSGSLWATHPRTPRRPIRAWQIWNEPELDSYWSTPGWAQGYTALLRSAHDALRFADPGSLVVAAGLTNRSWEDLAALYAAGAGRWFDVAAVHPYSHDVEHALKIVELARQAMRNVGDGRKPLLLSETSWSSGLGTSTVNYGWEETEAGQAERIREALPAFAARRRELRLAGVYWYTWMTPALGGPSSFEYSGLRRLGADGRPVDKPALYAWREALSGLTR